MTNSISQGTTRQAGGVLYFLERSNRKTLCLMVTETGQVKARAPRRMAVHDIDAFVAKKAVWVHRKLAQVRPPRPAPTREHEQAMRERGQAILPVLVARYAPVLGVRPNKVSITGAAKRFGSCSSKGTLCFSWRLFQYPMAAIEYVVVHELAHLIHLNHSRDFHGVVARVLPDWQQRKKLLRQEPE